MPLLIAVGIVGATQLDRFESNKNRSAINLLITVNSYSIKRAIVNQKEAIQILYFKSYQGLNYLTTTSSIIKVEWHRKRERKEDCKFKHYIRQ